MSNEMSLPRISGGGKMPRLRRILYVTSISRLADCGGMRWRHSTKGYPQSWQKKKPPTRERRTAKPIDRRRTATTLLKTKDRAVEIGTSNRPQSLTQNAVNPNRYYYTMSEVHCQHFATVARCFWRPRNEVLSFQREYERIFSFVFYSSSP